MRETIHFSLLFLVVALVPTAALARPGGGRGGGVRSSAHTSVNRNTNVNRNSNVNVNVNRDVNVHTNSGYYGGGCCYHPVAAAATVVAATAVTAAVIGSVVASVPPSCQTVVVNGYSYMQCGSTWYQPQFVGSSQSYVVVSAPR
jgi:hypothetical protein